MTSYYKDDFGSVRHMQGQLVNSRINVRILGNLLDLTAINNVLDVGTGYGFLLEALQERTRIACTGIELSRRESDHARNKLHLNVVNSPLRDAGISKESFDLVTSFEVIEHVPHPIAFLTELAEYIKPGGYLLIMTDNFESRMAKSLGAGFPKWIPHAHISHFSGDTLESAIQAVSGLSLLKAASYTPWEVLVRDAYYRIRGIRKTPADAFDLGSTLASEMTGTFRLFFLRRHFNSLWARVTLSADREGDLLYFLCRKALHANHRESEKWPSTGQS